MKELEGFASIPKRPSFCKAYKLLKALFSCPRTKFSSLYFLEFLEISVILQVQNRMSTVALGGDLVYFPAYKLKQTARTAAIEKR